MKRLAAMMVCAAACVCARAAAAETAEYDLLPEGKGVTFASRPGEFKELKSARSARADVDGAGLFGALPAFGPFGALKIRMRATRPDTRRVEVTVHQSDGRVWGNSGVELGPDWEDVVLPFAELKYFAHWGLTPVPEEALPDAAKFTRIHFTFGRWLCEGAVDREHGFEVASVKVVRLPVDARGDGRDHSIEEFAALPGEEDDTGRFARAILACAGGVLEVPRGVYRISAPLTAGNDCSFRLNKGAVLRAVKPMETVLTLRRVPYGRTRHDYNVFFRGGVIDGNGMASCLRVAGFAHFTAADTTLLNGREWGLRVDDGYEFIANNIYCKCVMSGLAGNIGILVNGGDSHYTDCIVVDYTIGMDVRRGGSNRLTRCHVWGGPVPPPKKGELPEMLKGSVNFRITASDTVLRDCYGDTGETGFEVAGWNTRLLGCAYFNNKSFGLDNITVIRHTKGRLLVSDCHFVKTTPNQKVYEGCGEVVFRDILYSGFPKDADLPGALDCSAKQGK